MAASSGDFRKHLRSTLNHLYNPEYLRSCLLASQLGLGECFTTPIRLQEIITQAIESIRQIRYSPAESQPYFYYDLLYYRYIQKLSQEEVANQLGISTRQVAREQDRAIDLLAKQLFDRYPSLGEVIAGPARTPAETAPGQGEGLENELDWLEKELPVQPVNLLREIETVLELVEPLAHQHQIRIETDLDPRLPELAAHPVTLRQSLLTVINAAIDQARGDKITIHGAPAGNAVITTISSAGKLSAGEPGTRADDETGLGMAARLLEKNRGSIAVRSTQDLFEAQIVLPTFFHQVVLLIDDNLDFHQLVQRYLFDTPYHVVCTGSPGEAIDLVEKHGVQLILLDVMMPEIDGWQVLGQLRRHPKTSHIPVIVCTIIAQADLAYSLGARAFLRKPVTREMLVEALDRLVGASATGPG